MSYHIKWRQLEEFVSQSGRRIQKQHTIFAINEKIKSSPGERNSSDGDARYLQSGLRLPFHLVGRKRRCCRSLFEAMPHFLQESAHNLPVSKSDRLYMLEFVRSRVSQGAGYFLQLFKLCFTRVGSCIIRLKLSNGTSFRLTLDERLRPAVVQVINVGIQIKVLVMS